MVLGLANEAGEVAGKFKKILRGDAKFEDQRNAIKDELGDVAWYLACTAHLCGFTLEEVLNRNLEKLEKRVMLGTQQGDGDDR